MKTKFYDFYADPGHGWLKVKRSELVALNILNEISGYSYQNGDCVFLEEDCDVSIFIRAMKNQEVTVKIREHYTNRESKIRNYESFAV